MPRRQIPPKSSLLLVGLTNTLILALYIFSFWHLRFAWDLDVYLKAIEMKEIGLTGFEDTGNLNFVYHPYILEVIALIDTIYNFRLIYLSFYLLTLFTFFRKSFIENRGIPRNIKTIFLLICLSAILGAGGIGYLGILSFNISIPLHLVILLLLYRAPGSNFRYFELVVVLTIALATFIKPYFIAYLFIFILLKFVKNFWMLVTIFIIASLTWLSGMFVLGASFHSYLHNLTAATFTSNDLGGSFFGLFFLQLGFYPALVLHLIANISIFFLYWRRYKESKHLPWQTLLLAVPIIVLNPRMKEYDFAVLLMILTFAVIQLTDFELISRYLQLTSLVSLTFVILLLANSEFVHLFARLLLLILSISLGLNIMQADQRQLK